METTNGCNAAAVQVSNLRLVPPGARPGQESRVGDTGYNGGRHLTPVDAVSSFAAVCCRGMFFCTNSECVCIRALYFCSTACPPMLRTSFSYVR